MVETFTSRTVQQSGQAPGYLQVNYSPDAFGAAVGRALGNLGNSFRDFSGVVMELDKQKKANDVQNYVNAAKDEVRPIFFDPNVGIYAQSAQNAMGSLNTARAAMNNTKDKYLKEIKDPQMQQAFTKIWDRETESALDKSSVHEMEQLGAYKVSTAKNTLTQSVTDAYNNYNDPKAFQAALDSADAIIVNNSLGLDEAGVKSAREDAKSQVTLAAISRWASEDPYKALEFYDKHKDALSGKDHIVANQMVNAAKDMREAELEVTRIKSTTSAASSDLWGKLIQAESSGNPGAISPDGALGKAQVLPGTAREVLTKLGMTDQAQLGDADLEKLMLTNSALNETIGKYYLNEQLKTFHGDQEAALVAYNAGPERARVFLAHNAGKQPGQRDYNIPGYEFLKKETEPYVQKILGGTGNFWTTPEGYRMSDNNWTLKNFQPNDLMAPTAGGRWVDARAAQGLDDLATVMQQRFGIKVSVNEKNASSSTMGKRRGTADPADNPHVEKSQHLQGRAFDVQWQGWSPEQKAAFIVEARQLGFSGFGFYGEGGHIHIDMGRSRTWGPVPEYVKASLSQAVTVKPGAGPQTDQTSQNSLVNQLPSSGSGLFGVGASGPRGAFVSTKAADLNSWMAQADSIADPGTRSRVKEMLRNEAALQEQANKEEIANLKQSAWNTVLNGSVKDLTKDVLAQLGPEFVSQLNTFETNRNKREMPMDWEAWSNIPTDPQTLANMDAYSEYRNKLDNEHFDRLLTMIREARKATQGQEYDKAMLSGTRSAQEIIKNAAAIAGWTESRNPKQYGAFAARMDQQLISAQQEKGKPLTAVEVQDIADKLLISGKIEGTFYNSGSKALEASDPNKFIAAANWDAVQPDDQQTLMSMYSRFYKDPPDQEAATDLYNRSMRVWLGGDPELTDDEKTILDQKFNVDNSKSAQRMKVIYGRYLLSFLSGRF